MATTEKPATKVCTRCGVEKDIGSFRIRVIKKPNKTYRSRRSECNGCSAERVKNWIKKKRESGDYSKHVEQWNKNRKPLVGKRRKRRNKKKREWHRMARGESLDRSRVRPKYRHELESGPSPRTLEALAVAQYLDRFLIIDDDDGAYFLNGVRMSATDTRLVKRWRNGNTQRITEAKADEIATKYDLPPWEVVEAGKMAA